jgi:hypothetical protein
LEPAPDIGRRFEFSRCHVLCVPYTTHTCQEKNDKSNEKNARTPVFMRLFWLSLQKLASVPVQSGPCSFGQVANSQLLLHALRVDSDPRVGQKLRSGAGPRVVYDTTDLRLIPSDGKPEVTELLPACRPSFVLCRGLFVKDVGIPVSVPS